MNVYMSEQEQLQAVRIWLKKYGVSIIVGVVIAFIASYGWRFWLQHQLQQRQQASMLYEQMLITATDHQNQQQSMQIADHLMTEYPHTPYAALAGLSAANNAIKVGDLNLANQKLQWVIQHANSKPMQQIAKMRDARVLLAQNKPHDAMNLLTIVSNESFLPEVAIIKGDIFVALGDKVSAKTSYQQALSGLPTNAAIRPMVQMKFDELA